MSKRERGLYEVLITECLEQELSALGDELVQQRAHPDREEVADRVALHVSRVIERELRMVSAPERVSVSVKVAREARQ